jgi:hypothetical protein
MTMTSISTGRLVQIVRMAVCDRRIRSPGLLPVGQRRRSQRNTAVVDMAAAAAALVAADVAAVVVDAVAAEGVSQKRYSE